MDWTLVRATQFHELVAGLFAPMARFGVLVLPGMPLRTVASAEVAVAVAVAVADAAGGPALRARVEVAGPETADVRDLARQWRSVTGSRARIVPLVLPGAVGRAVRSGALTTERPDVTGTTTFAAWLEERELRD
ncbi:hypothetical protein [Streptomyces sp. NBC_00887]|uniref:hypothetical protein n=1 Tax=Streptomyces sp. NBC_00887 TaxID=2975859 RepID=UPI003868E097|nr:hypothetical protein OG844_26140 [Streptomyces sp. NBC_00887]